MYVAAGMFLLAWVLLYGALALVGCDPPVLPLVSAVFLGTLGSSVAAGVAASGYMLEAGRTRFERVAVGCLVFVGVFMLNIGLEAGAVALGCP